MPSDRRPRLTSARLEPAVPLLLAVHGAVSLFVLDASPVQFGAVTLVGALGLTGLTGWRSTTAVVVRALVTTGVALFLPLTDATLVPHVLQWWYALVAVYPLILPLRAALGASAALAGLLALEFPLGVATATTNATSWSLRALVLACIGVIVALTGDALRRASDTSERRHVQALLAEGELQRATTHDRLTGLPNRAALDGFIDTALAARSGDPDDQITVLLVDLDRFKNVNETLGHLTGDRLLREVAERLAAGLTRGQQIARLGGDEFVVLCAPAHPGHARGAAASLMRPFAEPVEVAGAPYQVGLSVGVAVSGGALQTRADLLRAADAAMYAAKRAGRGQAAVFDSTMGEDVAADLAIERRLRDAIQRGNAATRGAQDPAALCAVFQPIVDLTSGVTVAAEALARWQLDGRSVSPARFVPLAEELGLGPDLALLIARQSMRALSMWHQAGLTAVTSVAVNVGARDLLKPALADGLQRLVSEFGLPPGSLTLEITERDVVDDVEHTRAAMERLGKAGITVAVDDFGTGFSSLAYLARLPLNVLKIDREFVANLDQDDTIARTVVQLARSFAMGCIAEGVETPAQLAALIALGVERGQGWYLGRPGDAQGFVDTVRLGDATRSRRPSPVPAAGQVC